MFYLRVLVLLVILGGAGAARAVVVPDVDDERAKKEFIAILLWLGLCAVGECCAERLATYLPANRCTQTPPGAPVRMEDHRGRTWGGKAATNWPVGGKPIGWAKAWIQLRAKDLRNHIAAAAAPTRIRADFVAEDPGNCLIGSNTTTYHSAGCSTTRRCARWFQRPTQPTITFFSHLLPAKPRQDDRRGAATEQ